MGEAAREVGGANDGTGGDPLAAKTHAPRRTNLENLLEDLSMEEEILPQ